jgi:TRAP-type C4-dicarboxylate transport system substrate-binding protein
MMNLRKTGLIVLVGAMLCLLVLAGPLVNAAEKQYVLKIGYLGAADLNTNYEHVMAYAFKSSVETQTNGRVKVANSIPMVC